LFFGAKTISPESLY